MTLRTAGPLLIFTTLYLATPMQHCGLFHSGRWFIHSLLFSPLNSSHLAATVKATNSVFYIRNQEMLLSNLKPLKKNLQGLIWKFQFGNKFLYNYRYKCLCPDTWPVWYGKLIVVVFCCCVLLFKYSLIYKRKAYKVVVVVGVYKLQISTV